MEQESTKTEANGTGLFAGETWFDPAANSPKLLRGLRLPSRFGEIEAGIRDRVRWFIQELLEQELTTALGRVRHERTKGEPKGYRNGTRERQLLPFQSDAAHHSNLMALRGVLSRRPVPSCHGGGTWVKQS